MSKSICNILTTRLRDKLPHVDVTEELISAGAGVYITKPDPDWCMVEVVDPQIRWHIGSKYGMTDEGYSVTRMSFADDALESADFQFTLSEGVFVPEDPVDPLPAQEEARDIVVENIPPVPVECSVDDYHIHEPQVHLHITCDDVRPVRVQNFLVDVAKAANEVSRQSLGLKVKGRRRE